MVDGNVRVLNVCPAFPAASFAVTKSVTDEFSCVIPASLTATGGLLNNNGAKTVITSGSVGHEIIPGGIQYATPKE